MIAVDAQVVTASARRVSAELASRRRNATTTSLAAESVK
jgi:hypothetical protein